MEPLSVHDLLEMARFRRVRRRKEAMVRPVRFIRIPLRCALIYRNPLAFAMRETRRERVRREFSALFAD